MKKFNKAILYKACSACIALGAIIYYRCPSMFFFGEPEFPVEK